MSLPLKQWIKRRITLDKLRRSPLFDASWYIAHNTEKVPERVQPEAHYLDGGWKTGDPSARFSNEQYLGANLDVQQRGLCPLAHYLMYGKKEGRLVGSSNAMLLMAHYRAHSLRRGLSRAWNRLRFAGKLRANRDARVLVCLQMFYPKSWPEINEYLENLRPYHPTLVVTVQKGEAFRALAETIRQQWPEATILEVDNRGFDLGAFHESLKGIDLDQYDVVIKLHSKGTGRKWLYMYGQYFRRRDWLVYLFEGVCGAGNVHRMIDLLMRDEHCGLVAADNLLVHDPRHKCHLVRRVMNELGLAWPADLPEDYQFVAGTCFAAKARLVKPFQQLDITFDASARGNFSAAHGLERWLCFPMQTNGFRMQGLPVCGLRRALRKHQGAEHTRIDRVRQKLLHDDRFILDDDFVQRSLETLPIRSYQLIEIPLGDIRRRWFNGKIYPLEECAPYRYLCGDESAYAEYSEFHLRYNLPPMTPERFNALVESIAQNGYDPRHVIVIDQDFCLMDGQHRACCLLKHYGRDHRVQVLQINRV